jgi:hypothetical protein
VNFHGKRPLDEGEPKEVRDHYNSLVVDFEGELEPGYRLRYGRSTGAFAIAHNR